MEGGDVPTSVMHEFKCSWLMMIRNDAISKRCDLDSSAGRNAADFR